MPLEAALRDELQREIETEVAAVLRQAREQGEAMVSEAERWARELEAEDSRRLEEECALHTRRSLARIDLEQRNALLQLKEQELDRVFQEVNERLATLRDREPEAFNGIMAGVFDHCCRLLPEGPLRVRLGPGLEDLKRQLAGRKEVTLTEDPALIGLVVETENGRLHCDGTLPQLLRRLRRERGAELEAILFGETS